ncbi:hypothetical protein FA13DRAFT_1815691 [Coprinellus micaceus]|uniref:Uncharacterized protein n=1 Tax=Coprinellus micaceus TaxID=71717 RepID=A0A4Y7T3W3_COPMI|nr:hypothetical protein FA13DRAFT_1815691 [Coprinellus micaceus]
MASRSHFTNPIADFFASYPSFDYDRTASSSAFEFRRLCKHMGWEPGSPEQEAAWVAFQDALAGLFNELYGRDAVLEEAREAVSNTHVNLMDLAEAGLHPDRIVPIWQTEAARAAYTKRTQKIVSSRSPMAGGLLKALLRRILYPPDDDLRRDQYGNHIRRGPRKGRVPLPNQRVFVPDEEARNTTQVPPPPPLPAPAFAHVPIGGGTKRTAKGKKKETGGPGPKKTAGGKKKKTSRARAKPTTTKA